MTLTIKKKISLGNLQNKYLFLFNTYLGSKESYRNEKMDEYILGFDNLSTSVLNIDKTRYLLKRALKFLKIISKNSNKQILFVGTGTQTKKITEFLGKVTYQPYIHHRWLKGFLTNWENISPLIKCYKLFLKKLKLSGKKEFQLKQNFQGISKLKELPSALFILDINSNYDAILEAEKLSIPIIAIVDNNTKYVEKIDYPIICNKNSPLSLFFIISLVIQQLKK
jgi:small subunit ribosomal protein S2